MIDKVFVTLRDFHISARPKLALKLGKIDLETGENLYDFPLWKNPQTGDWVTGAGAHRNTDIAKIDIDMRGLKVEFNPAVVCHGNNFLKIKDSQELKSSFDTIKALVKDTGIECDFDSGNIQRIDLAKDREMAEPYLTYKQLFRFLEAKRATPRDFGETYYFTNKSRQVSFYDKIHEMESKNIKVADFGIDGKNIMRCELRLLNSKTVVRNTGIHSIKALGQGDSFNNLGKVYNDVLSDFVFRDCNKGGQLRFNFLQEIDKLIYFKNTYKRNSLQRYLASYGIENVLRDYGSIENFKSVMLQAGYDRTYVFKEMREIQKQVLVIGEINEKYSSKRTVQSLYDEVYSKVLAA